MIYLLIFISGGIAFNNPSFYKYFFILNIFFYFKKYLDLKKEKLNLDIIILIFMAYSLPFSWRNILGGDYGELPISWFHLFGVLYIVSVLLFKHKELYKKVIPITIFSALTFFISFIPLMYSSKYFYNQALSQFIVLTFNNVLIFFSTFRFNKLEERDIVFFKKSYITGALLTCLMIIIQYFLFKYRHITFGYVDSLLNRQLFYYLFTDISHGTLYFATAAFWLLYDTKNKNNKNSVSYVLYLFIFVASALTSARTGLFVLIAFSFLFILFGQKGIFKKIITMLVFGIVSVVGFEALQRVRQIDNLSQLTDGSGRLEGYTRSLKILLQSPFLGFGYSREFLVTKLGFTIPHLSILQYALHGGILFAVTLYVNQLLIFIDASRKKSVFSWILAMILVGTCLIPDLFATRFITLFCMISISFKGDDNKVKVI